VRIPHWRPQTFSHDGGSKKPPRPSSLAGHRRGSAPLHCNGTGSHICSMGPRSMSGLSPRLHTKLVGFSKPKTTTLKIPRQPLNREHCSLPGILPGAGPGSSSFLVRPRRLRISHASRVSADIPCSANAESTKLISVMAWGPRRHICFCI
jgi:hypothetical protein